MLWQQYIILLKKKKNCYISSLKLKSASSSSSSMDDDVIRFAISIQAEQAELWIARIFGTRIYVPLGGEL